MQTEFSPIPTQDEIWKSLEPVMRNIDAPTRRADYHADREQPKKVSTGDAVASDVEIIPMEFPPTDAGNGERFAAEYGGRIVYDSAGLWRRWTGTRWDTAGDDYIMRCAVDVVRSIREDAAKESDRDKAGAIFKHALRSESKERLLALIYMASRFMTVESGCFDANCMLLNCLNGVVNLSTGELIPHTPELWLTKQCPVEYFPDAYSPILDRVLTEAIPDVEVRRYVQKLAGYSLTGMTTEEILVFIYGPTGSAKSTFTDAFRQMMGDYAVVCEPEVFMSKPTNGNSNNASPELARLRGTRQVLVSETEAGAKLAAGLIKRATGNDIITCRELYKGTIEFKPQFKLWLVSNFRPRVDADDGAMWRRLRVIPFLHTILETQRDTSIKTSLGQPAAQSALLAWAVQGCLLWQQEGLQTPDAVRAAASADYRESQDSLADFFRERCVFSPAVCVTSKELKSAYDAWGTENDVPVRFRVSPKILAAKLRARGCEDRHLSVGNVWYGIGLKEE